MVKKTFTFENFYVGEENKIAVLAAQRVVEMPGAIFNPLYVYSDVGLGKSHLLHAIHAAFSAKLKSRMVNGSEFLEAIGKPGAVDLRQELREAECLVFDDLHVMSNSIESLREFSSLLEHFLVENRQVVVSANAPPQDLTNVDGRTRSRLEGGLVCELGHLKPLSRVNILKKKAEERGLILPDEIAQEIAQIVSGSVRELEGALNRLLAYSTIAQFPLDLNTARLALRDYYRTKSAEPIVPSLIEELKSEAYQAISMVEGDALAREEFKEKIYIWEMKGFDVSGLKPLLNQDIEALKAAYDTFVEKVKRLVELQKEFGAIDARRFPEEALGIEPLLFDPRKVDEVERRMQNLKQRLTAPRFDKTFEGYVVGECNEVVYGLGLDMVKNLGTKYNPLVIIGGRGSGKTHLLLALADRIQKDYPDRVVKYFDLVDSFPAAGADVLVLDNVDRLPQARHADFGRLLDQYVKEDKQLIFASSVPSLSIGWGPDIKYYFEFGIDAPLSPPDYRTIAEYLKLKGKPVPDPMPPINSFYDIEAPPQPVAQEEPVAKEEKEEPVPLGFPGEPAVVPAPSAVPTASAAPAEVTAVSTPPSAPAEPPAPSAPVVPLAPAVPPVPAEPPAPAVPQAEAIKVPAEKPKHEWVAIPSVWNEEVWEEY